MKLRRIFIALGVALIALFSLSCSPKQKKILRVGTDAENPPFNYLEGNEFKGIDIEICKRIAKKLNMQLQISKFEFDDLFSALAQNKIDIAASSITITEKRKQTVDFTEPYFDTINQTAVYNIKLLTNLILCVNNNNIRSLTIKYLGGFHENRAN